MRRTLDTLSRSPERNLVVPILASALGEPGLSGAALALLRVAPETRAPREIIRHYDRLDAEERRSLQEGTRGRLLVACQQLLRSDHTQTRTNIARFAADVLDESPASWGEVLPVLLLLIDDPRHAVRSAARQAFIAGLSRVDPADFRARSDARSPVTNGLAVLLRRFDQHEDPQLISVLFRLGSVGHDLLGRAIGEAWGAAPMIVERAESTRDDLDGVVTAVIRWLRSPFRSTRDAARGIVRGRTDAEFLTCI
ncbi:MAG: hypothetical protein KDC38_21000, partial [Planctomycetes bacterium]|nr:hypothetical protein [Planctomycetota bacterium]